MAKGGAYPGMGNGSKSVKPKGGGAKGGFKPAMGKPTQRATRRGM